MDGELQFINYNGFLSRKNLLLTTGEVELQIKKLCEFTSFSVDFFKYHTL